MKNGIEDLLNYKKTINENVAKYFNSIAEVNDIAAEKINIRVSKRRGLKVGVYDGNKMLTTTSIGGLIYFFSPEKSDKLLKLEGNIEKEISYYIDAFSAISGIESESLVINISKPAQNVTVVSYHDGLFFESIDLLGLIKYFNVSY